MHEHEDYKAILESISDGVFTVDNEWRITSFNRAAEHITGISRDEAIGSFCSEVFRSSLCGNSCALRKTLETEEPVINKSCYFIDSSGNRIPITLSTALFRNSAGDILGGAETFRDLSELEKLREQLQASPKDAILHSKSPSMQEVSHLVEVSAPYSSSILICGETGTGKEVLARTIHELSPRQKEPFVAVNCAALPENLLESALFGHKRGAFTGAVEDKAGLFFRAGKGTLFLDEIGDVSQALQIRLLRVLQEKEYEPVGSSKSVRSEARIITATNQDLEKLIEEGTFRQDLYYRLNIIKIDLPPLKERPEDIPALIEFFIAAFNKNNEKAVSNISSEAINSLLQYHWPGNIRELQNTIERACVVCHTGEITPICLPSEVRGAIENSRKSYVEERAEAERELIISTLEQTGNNKVAAAALLGMHKTTLFRKIKRYKIPATHRTYK